MLGSKYENLVKLKELIVDKSILISSLHAWKRKSKVGRDLSKYTLIVTKSSTGEIKFPSKVSFIGISSKFSASSFRRRGEFESPER